MDAGFLTTSWNDNKGVTLNDDETVFEMKFKVNGAMGASSEIKISSDIIVAEAYNGNIEVLAIEPVAGTVKVTDATAINHQPGGGKRHASINLASRQMLFVLRTLSALGGKFLHRQ